MYGKYLVRMLLRLLEHHGMHTTTVATLVVLLGLGRGDETNQQWE